jgi:hypothetical protein
MYSNTYPGGRGVGGFIHNYGLIPMYAHCAVRALSSTVHVTFYTYDFEVGLNKMFLEDSLSGALKRCCSLKNGPRLY